MAATREIERGREANKIRKRGVIERERERGRERESGAVFFPPKILIRFAVSFLCREWSLDLSLDPWRATRERKFGG